MNNGAYVIETAGRCRIIGFLLDFYQESIYEQDTRFSGDDITFELGDLQ